MDYKQEELMEEDKVIIEDVTPPAVPATPGTEPTKPDDKSYIKIREEKAQEKLLKQLGVTTIDEALEQLNSAKQTANKITDLEKQIEQAKEEKIRNSKVSQLTSILESEKVFDSDALLHYVELDKVQLDTNGKLVESEKIISELKALKPNYFGREKITSDPYVQGGNPNPASPVEEAYKSGDYVKAISTYLKTQK